MGATVRTTVRIMGTALTAPTTWSKSVWGPKSLLAEISTRPTTVAETTRPTAHSPPCSPRVMRSFWRARKTARSQTRWAPPPYRRKGNQQKERTVLSKRCRRPPPSTAVVRTREEACLPPPGGGYEEEVPIPLDRRQIFSEERPSSPRGVPTGCGVPPSRAESPSTQKCSRGFRFVHRSLDVVAILYRGIGGRKKVGFGYNLLSRMVDMISRDE